MSTRVPAGSILVGVDGSEAGSRAVRWATDQARLEHRPLVLVHATSPLVGPWAGEPGFDTTRVLEAITKEGEDLLEDTYAELHLDEDDDLVVHRQFLQADPRQVLIDLSLDAAMIVLGSRGRGAVQSLLLGSVSVAVSQHASCPVVVMRPQDEVTARNRIVVGATVARAHSQAVDFAYRQASLRSLPLTVLHGFFDPLLGFAGASPLGDNQEAIDEESAVLEARGEAMKAKFPDVVVTYEVAQGLPDDCLLDASKGSGMVVVGTHRKSLAMSIFEGQVSRAVTEHATCMVAVVPES